MAKKDKEEKSEPIKAPLSSSDELVEVQALKTVNTSLYGSIREGQKGKIGAELALQLEEAGEVKIL